MRIILRDRDVELKPENKDEDEYVKNILEKALFKYKDTTILTWVNGIAIEGKKGE